MCKYIDTFIYICVYITITKRTISIISSIDHILTITTYFNLIIDPDDDDVYLKKSIKITTCGLKNLSPYQISQNGIQSEIKQKNKYMTRNR
jgi:hypothetical protein